MRHFGAAFLFAFVFSGLLLAQRDPVLKQIAHPHSYYFREMYLPQLTSGPSAVAWSRDSREVIYSMQGFLWRQALDSPTPTKLTNGPGYDYQPDWSPDGQFVVYSKYHADAIELWLLDLTTKKTEQLTTAKAVNVEARWSPDGTRIAFVSTQHGGYFHVFQIRLINGKPQPPERLTQETTTPGKRYYYGPVDHEISPTWSPDGKELIFIHNHDRIDGTGGIWRMAADPNAHPRLLLNEETTWRARPDWSPDGKRVVYASYERRQWHQLWLTTPEGGDPIPLTFGDHDNTNPRWSPDGNKVAFISNRNGNTELWFVDAVGGKQTKLEIRLPMSPKITIHAPHTRISVRGPNGRFYGPRDAWLHADDSFVRAEMPEEPRYFHCVSVCEVEVPEGESDVFIMRGLAYKTFSTRARAGATVVYPATPLPPLPGGRWTSADVHVHMNYAGTYRNRPEHMLQQARAEDVNLVFDLVVNKEQRIPDIDYFSTMPDKASTATHVLSYGQEFHTSNWGHMGLLGIKDHYLNPGYTTYPQTAAASPYPSNASIADMAHRQKGLVGYAHIYAQEDLPDPSLNSNHELPADVALGKVGYIEVIGFNDHRATAEIWYRLLNLGFRIPAAGGTDAMANYASLRGPVGLNRTYAQLPAGRIDPDSWLAQLKAGRTFATNAPLLNLTLGNRNIGDQVSIAQAGEVQFAASMRSIVPIDHLELVCNASVVKTVELVGDRTKADARGTIPIKDSGWCLLRAWNDKPKYPILDIYPYGTTSPIYLSVAGAPPRSPHDAHFFVSWMDHLIEHTEKMTDWNAPAEKTQVLDQFRRAREVFVSKQ